MKRLFLVRHGKSSWDEPLDDIDRPLKKRAYADASHVIKAFKPYLDFKINLFTSPANRANTTAELFKNGLKINQESFEVCKELYTFSSNDVLNFIKDLDDDLNNVMLFGHNPAYTSLVNQLGSLPVNNLPTTGLVGIGFEIDSWKKLKKGTTQLYLFPKHLR